MVSVLSAYLATPRVQIAALVYFLLAGAMTRLPLFNYLGYEFSAAMTIPAAFISGILTILFMREHRAKPLTRRTWLLVLMDYLLINTLLLLIPLAVISANAFVVKNCAFGTGLMYYALLTWCAMVFSVSLALVVGLLFRRGILMYCLTVCGVLMHILFVTYSQPQLFAYNFIMGFFPGITYDETLTDVTQIILYREFTLIASLMLMTLFVILTGTFLSTDPLSKNLRATVKRFREDLRLWSVVLISVTVIGTGHLFRAELGFEYSEEEIQHALGRRTESDHFVIYYQGDDHSAEEMRVLKAECEFHYRRVSDYLSVAGPKDKKISLYLYPDSEWKQRFIGTSSTNIAKPWKREIHLTTGTFRPTFRHELVHALAAEFGFPLIDASTRMGLNEGLAVAADWDEGMFTPHEYSAALLRLGGLEQTERLFSMTGFAAQSSTFAYLVSGSFSRYLIERFGMDRFRAAFSNGNFVAAFGEPLENLMRSWKAFLKNVGSAGLPDNTVKLMFFQQSIFYKICAREVASQNRNGTEALRKKEYLRAEREFDQAFNNAQTAGALRGLFQALNSQHRPEEVLKRFAELPEKSSLREHPAVLLQTADAEYLSGRMDAAAEYYRSIHAMRLSTSYSELALLRLQFIRDAVEPSHFKVLMYAGRPDSARIAFIDSISNIRGRQISLDYLKGILTDPSVKGRSAMFKDLAGRSSALQYFLCIQAADQFYREGSYEEAKAWYWQAINIVPTSALYDQIGERIEMCDHVMTELL